MKRGAVTKWPPGLQTPTTALRENRSMSKSQWQHHNRIDNTKHSKEDALSEREFELLWEGAGRMDGYRRTEARFIVMAAGRLGLRAGEIAHLREDWLDRRQQQIKIPAHQPCRKGKHGGTCGYCRQQIQQCVNYNDDVQRCDIDDHWWRPKTEAGVRGVPYDFQARAGMAIERFFDEFDAFERSYTAIGRRLKTAAELAPELDPQDIYPHALRATAATYHASRGLDVHPLTSLLGWANLSTAEVYIARSDSNTQRALRSAHSR